MRNKNYLKENKSLINEWNWNKNQNLNPDELTTGIRKKVWWICRNGHEWQATIANRKNGTGCPYCSGKKVLKGFNDFETWCKKNNKEYLIDDFDKNKNEISINEVTFGSGKKVWWKCKKGHEWRASINSRNSGRSCSFCSGRFAIVGETDLATTYPNLAKEWNYKKNLKSPNEIGAKTQKKYWWICPFGHEWEMRVYERTIKNKNCPYCNKF